MPQGCGVTHRITLRALEVAQLQRACVIVLRQFDLRLVIAAVIVESPSVSRRSTRTDPRSEGWPHFERTQHIERKLVLSDVQHTEGLRIASRRGRR